MWKAAVHKPELFIKPDHICDQRVSLPASDGVAVVSGSNIVRLMGTAIKIDQAPVTISPPDMMKMRFRSGCSTISIPLGV